MSSSSTRYVSEAARPPLHTPPSIHPFCHVLCVHQILQTHDQLLLIMEYASGGELFDYINGQGRLIDREAWKFLRQMLAGVEKLHRMAVVHRWVF